MVLVSDVADYAVVLGKDGQIASQGSLTNILEKDQSIFKTLNLAWAKKLPVITRKESPFKDAAQWEGKSSKRDQLDLSEFYQDT